MTILSRSIPSVDTYLRTCYEREQIEHSKGQDWVELVMDDLLDRSSLCDRHIQAVPVHFESSFIRPSPGCKPEYAVSAIYTWPDQC